ncbi:MAG: aspartate kinase [Sulfobacillus sp.]
MRVIVQKFGGTSLATAAGRQIAVQLVRRAQAEGFSVVVVVSAMGRRGDPYATDTLLDLVGPDLPVSAAERDRLQSVGELISAVVMSGELRRHQLEPVVMSGGEAGIVTDSDHGQAHIVSVDPNPLLAALSAAQVPVVAGFQGVGQDGQITTLGRGGSDTSAAALGVALAAERVEIYTDVPGVMSADPRQVPAARVVEHADYEEVFQLASLGAKVIHPRAIEVARQAATPLDVRQLTTEPGPFTRIGPTIETADVWQNRRPESSVVGVSVVGDLTHLRVSGANLTAQAIRRLFARLAAAKVSVDMINVFPEQVAVAIRQQDWPTAQGALAEEALSIERRSNTAKVSVVGTAIHGLPGVMSLVVETLVQAAVPILATSDSHQSISCLIPAESATTAAGALHRAFGLGGDGPAK